MEKVTIMTPDNIHLNSFMYEPLIDMSIRELKGLYNKVGELENLFPSSILEVDVI